MNALRSVAALAALVLVISGCKSSKQEAASPSAADVAPAAVAVTQTSWAPDALEELVAPIALYPDPLVGQILAASVNTQEVLDAGNWLLANPDLKGDALDAAAQKAGLGPATQALVRFPTVVDMMCQELDWTKQLGAAFTSDQKGVLDAIQRLRTSALNVGTLKTGPQQTVQKKSENGQTVIELVPTDPKVIYVPQYDPAVVYTAPPTTTVQQGSSNDAALAGLLGFGLGIAMGAAMSNNYCYPHYGYGAVYVGPRPFYPPAYAYRPVYSPAFRPAYGYRPPANYAHNYRGGNTNVVINNNNNYYNRFDHNSNLKGDARSPRNDRPNAGAGTRDQVATRPATGASGKDWKGKNAYAGAKPGGSKAVKDAQARVATKPAGIDRGYGGSDRSGAASETRQPTAAASNRASPAAASPRADAGDARIGAGSGGVRREVDAGTGANVLRSSGSTSGSTSRASSGSGASDAFSGANRQNSGSFDRAASARGHASTSGRSGGGGGGRR